MAVLNSIRKRGVFLIVIIALALFAFIFDALIRNGGVSNSTQNTLGSINGEVIKQNEFSQKVERAQRQQGRNSSIIQTVNRVWDQEVKNSILQEQYDALGLSIERDYMRDLLKQDLASFDKFKNEDGVFDENKMNEFILILKESSPKRMPLDSLGQVQLNYSEWKNIEKSLSLRAQEKTYNNLIKSGIQATLFEGEMDYNHDNNTVDFKYTLVPYTTIADSLVTVSDSDITKYIKAHPEKYNSEASRDIVFVEFKEEASEEDLTAIENNLKKLINSGDSLPDLTSTTDYKGFVNANSDIKFIDQYQFKKDFSEAIADSIYNTAVGKIYGPYKDNGYFKATKVVAVTQLPDSAKARHILIPFKGAASAGPEVTQVEADAKITADSILNVLKVNRSKFPELVIALSSDVGSVNNEGRYDWFPYNRMVHEFRDFVFENKIGSLDVVKTAFGFHIIEVEGHKNLNKAIKTATIAKKIAPSENTIDQVFNTVSKFEIALENTDFQEHAKSQNIAVKPVKSIKAIEENIPGIGPQRAIVRWAFNEESKIGDYKRFSLSDGTYVIAQLTAINKEGLVSAENAPAAVTAIIKKEKKAQLIRDKIIGTTLEEISKNQNQPIKIGTTVTIKNPTISGAGREPKVVGTAFGLKEDATSKLIDGEKGVYMVQIKKFYPATPLNNYHPISNRLRNAKKNAAPNKAYQALKKAADIEDNRSAFY